ncbi:DUF4065 domain-containing protein [Streptococcus danieliae]|nr:DUF4065 domain-containing protein [Streptococcus danieliae]
MITGVHVANTVLKRAFREKSDVTPMKLQKIVYIIYKNYLKETGKQLFLERFGAWRRGPVLPNIYSEFKQYRWNPITDYSRQNDGRVPVVKLETSPTFEKIFNNVWTKYKDVDAVELSEYTHLDGGAWKKAIENKTYILNDNDIMEEEEYELTTG